MQRSSEQFDQRLQKVELQRVEDKREADAKSDEQAAKLVEMSRAQEHDRMTFRQSMARLESTYQKEGQATREAAAKGNAELIAALTGRLPPLPRGEADGAPGRLHGTEQLLSRGAPSPTGAPKTGGRKAKRLARPEAEQTEEQSLRDYLMEQEGNGQGEDLAGQGGRALAEARSPGGVWAETDQPNNLGDPSNG